jgi:hypothetical protein
MRIAGAMVLTFLAAPAWAGLGGRVDAVAGEASAMGATVQRQDHSGFSVHELSLPAGTVREYADGAGEVFAVAWTTAQMPDLRTLLAGHYTVFSQAAHQSTHRRGPVMVRTDEVVIESGGHPRAFRGRAYLPGRLPAAVRVEDVR